MNLSHKHIFTPFNRKKTPKNRYTKKQPIHFSTTPLRPKFKTNFFRNLKISKFSTHKTMTPKSQAKIKPLFLQYRFLTIINPKKASCEQMYDF